MNQAPQAESEDLDRPMVAVFFSALLLAVAGICIYAVVRGGARWPLPVAIASVCVIMAQGVWGQKEWARAFSVLLLGISLFVVPLAIMGFWWRVEIFPFADLFAIICACPTLLPLAYLMYWFLSNEHQFE